MKKLAVIILVVMIAVVSLAANAVPNNATVPIKNIYGTVRFSKSNICMVQDYIPLPSMDNVYLLGKGFPTRGQYTGCQIRATGYYISTQPCKIFMVTQSQFYCTPDVVSPSGPSPDQ